MEEKSISKATGSKLVEDTTGVGDGDLALLVLVPGRKPIKWDKVVGVINFTHLYMGYNMRKLDSCIQKTKMETSLHSLISAFDFRSLQRYLYLFGLIIYIPINNFSSMSGWVFPG